MKKSGLILFFLALCVVVQAQKLMLGERAPEIKISEWIGDQPSYAGKATLIEFFHSPSKPSQDRLPVLAALAKQYQADLNVVLLAREPREKIAPLVNNGAVPYGVALDENGKTFANFGVQYVPFAVLLDRAGKVVWSGNSSQMTPKEIDAAIRSAGKR